MKIRTKLVLLSVILIVLVVAIGSIILLTFRQVNKEVDSGQKASEIMKHIFELNMVTYEYLMHHVKRMEHQWKLKYGSLGKMLSDRILEKEKEGYSEELYILKSIDFDYRLLGDHFTSLQNNFVNRKTLIKNKKSKQNIDLTFGLEERLAAQVQIRAHKIVSEAFQLSRLTEKKIARIEYQSNLIALFGIIGFVALLSYVSFLSIRAITRPLGELTNSAIIIGKGNLKHRVRIKSRDEIGILANAFNKMVTNLNEVTASRDDLNKEVYVRKQTEKVLQQQRQNLSERIKELNCLYRISTLIQRPETTLEEILQEVVELLPSSWQYPEITSARILWDQREYLTKNFKKTKWIQSSSIIAADRDIGCVEVIYLEERPEEDDGPFLKEEKNLIHAITQMLGKTIEHFQAEVEIENYQKNLEKMVKQRTAELDKRILEVERLNRAMVNLLEDLRVSNESLESASKQLVEANEELDAFTYSVSHDLRAPLRAITGFSEMLVEDYGHKLDEDGQRQLGVIQNSVRGMGQLIDDLLAFSRLGRRSLKMSDIDIRGLVDEVTKTLQLVEKKQKISLNVKELPLAFGDRAMIREVLVNLISNAIKYSRPIDKPTIEISGRIEGDESIYNVKDNGVGFNMKYVDKLFQVFQRLHSAEEFEGTGIGLALVQRIIHRHGGRVWGEGKENEGAAFYFSLPRS